MPRFVATGCFFLLAAITVIIWQHRFVVDPSTPPVTLAELSPAFANIPGAQWDRTNQQLTLTRLSGTPPIVLKQAFPGIDSAKAMHFSLQLSSEGLALGTNPWDDGRCFLEWRDPSTQQRRDVSAVGSIRDSQRIRAEVVLRAPKPPATPVLLLEHLGAEGSLTIEKLIATAVVDSTTWKVGRVVLPLAWAGWAWFSLLAWSRARHPLQQLISALVLVVAGMVFVLPGPWKAIRPLRQTFALQSTSTDDHSPRPPAGPTAQHADDRPDQLPPALSVPPQSVGKLPVQGGLVLKVKKAVPFLRPFLHVLLLFGPALAFALFSGRAAAIAYGSLLAVMIELAQTSMGYGFDGWDVLDLICDAAGIALALIAHNRFSSWQQRLCLNRFRAFRPRPQ